MNKIKNLWDKHGRWILLGLPVVIVVISLAVNASKTQLRTIAEPPAETEITFDMDKSRVYTASDGIIVIGDTVTPTTSKTETTPPVAATKATSEAAAIVATTAKIGGAYTLPQDAQMADGSLGVLSIVKLGLTVNIYETDDEMEAMSHGLAHFKTTSAWSGNIGLCGHNINFNLTDGYLKNLHTLKAGDIISYKTALGSRNYVVETVAEIAETDWSYLNRTEDDRITIITCISGKPRSRLVVQGTAK